MKRNFAYLSVLVLTVTLLTGCGNTRQLEASIAEKQAMIDDLRKENQDLKSENAKLKGRVGELEKNLTDVNARAVDVKRELDQMKAELERAKSPKKGGDLDAAYRDALRKYMDKRYDEAVAAFEALLAAGIPAPLDDNCHYWIGESFFGLKNYQAAIARFDEVLEFEWSNKKDDSQVMIARCYARMGETARAKTEYQKVLDVYPASPYLDLARRRSGVM